MYWRDRLPLRSRRKQQLCEVVAAGHRPGLLAYEGSLPVGWVSLGPREELARLQRSRTLGPGGPEPGVFSIVCFYVDTAYRGRGISGALLDAAITFAREQGAASLEACPLAETPPYAQGNRRA
jgi:GNAT superfamily N-acetyltransferase